MCFLQAAVGDGSRMVDLLVQSADGSVQVAVEVDGPTHFLRSKAGKPLAENCSTLLRNWTLQTLWGIPVVSLCVVNKSPKQLMAPEFEAWLLGKLQKIPGLLRAS